MRNRPVPRVGATRLAALGGSNSAFKDAAMRLGALNWGLFFQAQPDTPHKLAAFAFAFEHLEIAGYEQLKRVAERAGDEATVETADRILAEEHEAAKRVAGLFDAAGRGVARGGGRLALEAGKIDGGRPLGAAPRLRTATCGGRS
jgi:Domain of unknown function (DUF892)